MKKIDSEFTKMKSENTDINKMFKQIMAQNQHSSPDKIESPKFHYPDTVVTANKNSPPSEGGNSMEIGGTWNLKQKTRSPKFYELIIKTELKGDTALGLNNFYNRINMCINAVTILR